MSFGNEMATANVILANGSKVVIEGSADEVATLLSRLSDGGEPERSNKRRRTKSSGSAASAKQKQKRGSGPRALLEELIEENFFKGQRRTIGDIQKKLEENGHIYAQHSLSPALLRLTRARTLRRIKEKKGWVYVK
jgi:hypothetical protein